MIKGYIASLKELDLSTLTYEQIRWQYGTFRSYSKGTRSNKITWYENGVMTPIGEIEESVWYQAAEHIIQREHEEELFNQLLQYESETTHNGCFKMQELKHYTLKLFVSRIFDAPGWIGFIPFNRKYRPEFVKDMKFVKIQSECCGAIGDVTQEQIRFFGAPCPKCGRWAPFTRLDGFLSDENDCNE